MKAPLRSSHALQKGFQKFREVPRGCVGVRAFSCSAKHCASSLEEEEAVLVLKVHRALHRAARVGV